MNSLIKNIDSMTNDYWGEIDSLSIDFDPTIEEMLLPSVHDPSRFMWLHVILTALEDLGIKRGEAARKIPYSEWLDAKVWVTDTSPRGDFAVVCGYAKVSYVKLNKYLKSLRCPCCKKSYLKKPCSTLEIDYDS